MSTPERSHQVRTEGRNAHGPQEGTNVQRPPAFQLQASPLAPVQRQQGQPQNESSQEGQEQEAGESVNGGRVGLGQSLGQGQAQAVATEEQMWEQFALAFSQNFRSILPVFDPGLNVDRPDPLPASAQAPRSAGGRGGRRRRQRGPSEHPAMQGQPQQVVAANVTPAEGANAQVAQAPAPYLGPRISAQYAQAHFTVLQRTELMAYFDTHILPEQFFTGGHASNLPEQERISMAAHMLANGRFRRGEVQQRVHGRHCGNWAEIVLQYAGLGPRTGSRGGTAASLDFMGNVMTSNANISFNAAGSAQSAANLPATEGATTGPMHGDQLSAFNALEPNDPRRAAFGRMPNLGWDYVRTLTAGDWIYEYNANSDPHGMHSVIFIRWIGGERFVSLPDATRVHYRTALVFSQPDPDRGGRQHTVTLGERYMDSPAMHPVCRIARSRETGAGITREGVLPNIARREPRAQRPNNRRNQGRRRRRLPPTVHELNERYITQTAQRLNRIFNRDRFIQHLRDENTPLITQLRPRMSAMQAGAMNTINNSQDLEDVFQLNLRLHQLVENAENWDGIVDERVGGERGLNARHAAWEARQAALQANPPGRRQRRNTQAARPDPEPYNTAQVISRGRRSEVRVNSTLESRFPAADFEQFFEEPAAVVARQLEQNQILSEGGGDDAQPGNQQGAEPSSQHVAGQEQQGAGQPH